MFDLRLLNDPVLRSAYAGRNLEIVRDRATQGANMARMNELYRELQRGRRSHSARRALA